MSAPGYYIDLNSFALDKLKSQLKTTRLIPSQRILLEKIDERFACLERNGIDNLGQLQKTLKSKASLERFSKTTGLPVDYLTILRREVNSYLPKPVGLADFPGVGADLAAKLSTNGINNTEQLFPHVLTPESRSQLAKTCQVEDEDILEMAKLTDLARLKYVGPKFARLLIESGYDTVEKIARSQDDEVYHALVRVNDEKGLYEGKFGADDLRSWIKKVVREMPLAIKY